MSFNSFSFRLVSIAASASLPKILPFGSNEEKRVVHFLVFVFSVRSSKSGKKMVHVALCVVEI